VRAPKKELKRWKKPDASGNTAVLRQVSLPRVLGLLFSPDGK